MKFKIAAVLFILLAILMISCSAGNKYIKITMTLVPEGGDSGEVIYFFHFLNDGTPVSIGGITAEGNEGHNPLYGQASEEYPFIEDIWSKDFFSETRQYDSNSQRFIFYTDKTGELYYSHQLAARITIVRKTTDKLPEGIEAPVDRLNKVSAVFY